MSKSQSQTEGEPEPRRWYADSDAEAAVKFAIQDGIAHSWNSSTEETVEEIYALVTDEGLEWALREVLDDDR